MAGRGLQWTVPALQDSFPHLLAHMIGFGAVLCLAMYGLGRLLPFIPAADPPPTEPRAPELVPPLVQALVVGGVGGLLGAWVFLWGIETAGFFPLVAGMVGMRSPAAGGLGALFHRLGHRHDLRPPVPSQRRLAAGAGLPTAVLMAWVGIGMKKRTELVAGFEGSCREAPGGAYGSQKGSARRASLSHYSGRVEAPAFRRLCGTL